MLAGSYNATMTTRSFEDTDIQAALEGKDVVVLSTLTSSGGPLAMPMWFVHDNSHLVMVSAPGLAKVHNMERDPRVCVVAEGGSRDAPYGLVLTGNVTFLDGDDRLAWGDRFHAKYTPVIDRLWGGTDIPDNRLVFGLKPRVASAYGI